MPLDPEIAAHLERQKGQPPRSALDVAATRAMMLRGASLAGTPPELALVQDFVLADIVRARDYRAKPGEALPLIVYFHGGRFFSGDLESHDTVCRMLAVASECRVVAVEYRLAPEHLFPAAVKDAAAAVEWALGVGVPVAVAGDSAGANLAAGAALRMRGGAIRCQALIYPMIDATCSMDSYAEFAGGYGPGAEDMKRGWRTYMPESTDPRDPMVSPLHAHDVTGAARAMVVTAEYDTLRDEGEAYARKLDAAGVCVTFRRYEGTIHGFFTMPGILGAARKAIAEVGTFLQSELTCT